MTTQRIALILATGLMLGSTPLTAQQVWSWVTSECRGLDMGPGRYSGFARV
jgi:hypothetical protein